MASESRNQCVRDLFSREFILWLPDFEALRLRDFTCRSSLVTLGMQFKSFFKRQIQVARVTGIPVRIDYRWFVIFALSVWLVAVYFERGALLGIRVEGAAAWLLGLATTLTLFVSVFGHELAHALMARAENIETREIILHPFGGFARLGREPDSPRAEFRIAVAGPAASFLFAVVSFALVFTILRSLLLVWAMFLLVGFWNLAIAIFNLLPGYPLDGGRVLRAYLWHRTGNLNEATRTAARGGQLIAWMLVVFAVYILLEWKEPLMSLWALLVSIFMWDAARTVAHSGATRRKPTGRSPARTVSEAMSAPFSIEPDMLVSYFVDHVLPIHRQRAFAVAPKTNGAKRLHGILTLEDLKKLPRERWHRTRVRDVMRPVNERFFVEVSAPLESAEELMRENGAFALGVLNSSGELIGFIQR
jgi:Zn-dependent protease